MHHQIASAIIADLCTTGVTGQCKYPGSKIDFMSAAMRWPTVMRGELHQMIN